MSLFYSVISICLLMVAFAIVLFSCQLRFKSKVMNFIVDFLRLVLLFVDALMVIGVLNNMYI